MTYPPDRDDPVTPPEGHVWCDVCRAYGRVPTGEREPQPHAYPDQPPTRTRWTTCPQCGGLCFIPAPGQRCTACDETIQRLKVRQP